jgi:DNA-binding LacI/PurR family transcriptional regulator
VTRLPFRINREEGESFTNQVAAGLRHAIRSGVFRAGDLLPTRKEMAKQTGISEIIIRHAVKRLADEGLVRVRKHAGVTVSSLRGHVLYLTWSIPSMYYPSVLRDVVTQRLHDSNVFLSVTHISYEDAAKGFPKVQAEFTHAISLAVVDGIANDVDELLARKGIPFIHFTLSSHTSPLAAGAILMRRALVFPAIRDHCLACGARDVMMVGLFTSDEWDAQLGKLLADAGVRCRTMAVQLTTAESPEVVERRAINAMDTWLEHERRLPDLLWFNDDFVARGALTAMANRGIRIPDDVQVISWANAGLGPVFVKPLTRVEMDPIQHGEAVAACVLQHLEGKHSSRKPVVLSPAFIEGATTVKKA